MKKRSIQFLIVSLVLMFGFAVAFTWAGYKDKAEAPIIVADLPNCVETGQPCTQGGLACCDSTKSCTGTFPNYYCQ